MSSSTTTRRSSSSIKKGGEGEGSNGGGGGTAPAPPSLSQQALSQTLASTAHLANLLPTGTLLTFQLLTPVFTNNGTCDAVTAPLTAVLLALLAASCFLACFTDSFHSGDGTVRYGLATPKGIWVFDGSPPPPDPARYRARFIDAVHAAASAMVFATVAIRDRNVVGCFWPRPGREAQEVLDIVPLGVGVMCGFLFVVFPTRRHGIGFPVTAAPAAGDDSRRD